MVRRGSGLVRRVGRTARKAAATLPLMEYISITSHDSSGLVDQLRERDAEGWRVIGISCNHEGLVAILGKGEERGASGGDSSAASTASPSVFAMGSGGDSSARDDRGEASEPAGWGTAPEAAPKAAEPTFGAAGNVWERGEQNQQGQPSYGSPSGGYSDSVSTGRDYGSGAINTTSAPVPSSAPTIPMGWYSDPSGRYELRYWDGNGWTEHVSRAGQQYTDPPVA